MKKIIFIVFSLLSFFFGCDFFDESKIDLRLRLRSHSFNPGINLKDRIAPPSNAAMSIARIGIPNGIGPYILLEKDRELIWQTMMAVFPKKTIAVLEKRLIGLNTVFGMPYAGLTCPVWNDAGEIFFYIFLDAGSFDPKYRTTTHSIFALNQTETIEYKSDDNLSFILLHEWGHVIDFLTDSSGALKSNPLVPINNDAKPHFGDREWLTFDTLRPDLRFPLDLNAMNENQTKVSGAEFMNMYSQLEKNPFVTLYAATKKAEDFAETWKYFHAVERLGYSSEIKITFLGKTRIFDFYRSEAMKDKRNDMVKIWESIRKDWE